MDLRNLRRRDDAVFGAVAEAGDGEPGRAQGRDPFAAIAILAADEAYVVAAVRRWQGLGQVSFRRGPLRQQDIAQPQRLSPVRGDSIGGDVQVDMQSEEAR